MCLHLFTDLLQIFFFHFLHRLGSPFPLLSFSFLPCVVYQSLVFFIPLSNCIPSSVLTLPSSSILALFYLGLHILCFPSLHHSLELFLSSPALPTLFLWGKSSQKTKLKKALSCLFLSSPVQCSHFSVILTSHLLLVYLSYLFYVTFHLFLTF